VDNIKPKSIAREMYEEFMSFHEYIKEYELQRSEGTLLRYLSEVLKVMTQTVPDKLKNDTFIEMQHYISGIIRRVDSSLMDEWEKIKNPLAPILVNDGRAEFESASGKSDITKNKIEFKISVRNEIFQFLRHFARGDVSELLSWIEDSNTIDRQMFDRNMLSNAHQSFVDAKGHPVVDQRARGGAFFNYSFDESDKNKIKVRQTLIDEFGHNDSFMNFEVDVEKSRQSGKVELSLCSLVI
ncbi:MAG: DUF3516 domain-containing protein, partial [Proteobacteria bacterium]|nr:DUF3516 domain-containing protein [Pseudomonadota bacterium]